MCMMISQHRLQRSGNISNFRRSAIYVNCSRERIIARRSWQIKDLRGHNYTFLLIRRVIITTPIYMFYISISYSNNSHRCELEPGMGVQLRLQQQVAWDWLGGGVMRTEPLIRRISSPMRLLFCDWWLHVALIVLLHCFQPQYLQGMMSSSEDYTILTIARFWWTGL